MSLLWRARRLLRDRRFGKARIRLFGTRAERRLPAYLPLSHLPNRDAHPARRYAEIAACDHVAEKMKIGADQPDRHRQHAQRVEQTEPRIADPQDRHHGAGHGRVSGGKRSKGAPAVEGMKAVRAVLYE